LERLAHLSLETFHKLRIAGLLPDIVFANTMVCRPKNIFYHRKYLFSEWLFWALYPAIPIKHHNNQTQSHLCGENRAGNINQEVNFMTKSAKNLKCKTQSKIERIKSWDRPRLQKDPIKAGVIISLVLLICLSSIAAFIGAIVVGFTNIKLAVSLLTLFGATLRMAYKIVITLIA
jgi:hypothetical protein